MSKAKKYESLYCPHFDALKQRCERTLEEKELDCLIRVFEDKYDHAESEYDRGYWLGALAMIYWVKDEMSGVDIDEDPRR